MKTILDFNKMKGKEPISWLTAYSLPFAQAAERANCDIILVGDSGGMCERGYLSTNPVTMDEMIHFCKSVKCGASNTFIVGDHCQGSYEVSDEEAVRNALRFIKEASCSAVKLEGGKRVFSRIKAIVDAGILCVAHLGLTPISAASFGGYKVQGKTPESFDKTVEDALAVQEAGACMLLLEAMPEEPAHQISKLLKIPVLGIGAGRKLDGQLVIMHDLMGFFQEFRPWFAKCYVPEVIDEFKRSILESTQTQSLKEHGRETRKDGLLYLAELAIKKYISDVKCGKFPDSDYTYPLKDSELAELKTSKYWNSAI